jgi:hypothetical protein
MTSRRKVIRFAVGSPDGPRSSIWRVWTERDGSVYLAVRKLAGRFKASLHPRGWRIAYASLSDAQRLALGTPPTDRAIDKFLPSPEVAPGVRRGFVVLIPSLGISAPRDGEVANGDIHWLSPAPADHLVVEVSLFLLAGPTEGWPGRDSMGTQLLGSLPLQGDAAVWIVNRVIEPSAPFLDNCKAAQAEAAAVGLARPVANSDYRILVSGEMHEDGCRFFVDLKVPDDVGG